MSRNPGITLQNIFDNPLTTYEWKWYRYESFLYIPVGYGKECKWNSMYMSMNPNLTLDIVKQHPEIDWCWYRLSNNEGITMQDIVNHPTYPWRWQYVSLNINLTMTMVNSRPAKGWNWADVSCHPGITMQDIKTHPHLPWQWEYVIANNFTLDKELYVSNLYAAILLLTMLEHSQSWSEEADDAGAVSRVNVLHDEYHLSNIVPYV